MPLPVKSVAPRAGAWIETRRPLVQLDTDASRPVRARGLKRGGGRFDLAGIGRAPCGRVD